MYYCCCVDGDLGVMGEIVDKLMVGGRKVMKELFFSFLVGKGMVVRCIY